jgi:hypothetical protein
MPEQQFPLKRDVRCRFLSGPAIASQLFSHSCKIVLEYFSPAAQVKSGHEYRDVMGMNTAMSCKEVCHVKKGQLGT